MKEEVAKVLDQLYTGHPIFLPRPKPWPQKEFTWAQIEEALGKCSVADLEPYEEFLEELANILGVKR